jgi:hypothetical protein
MLKKVLDTCHFEKRRLKKMRKKAYRLLINLAWPFSATLRNETLREIPFLTVGVRRRYPVLPGARNEGVFQHTARRDWLEVCLNRL